MSTPLREPLSYTRNELGQMIRMQGQHHDRETGLFYNRYRYYQPNSGRYLTQDPVGLRGGVNIYDYVVKLYLLL